ncbi:MAG: GNAT family N-acetyltransferase [Bacteroidetes bacterium]|nr:GNAT family N-acetyltransferase [Bacteroidota bacterium]
MVEYKIERISETNLTHLITLYKNAFGIDVSLDFLLKKYATKEFGAAYIGYLAITNDNIPAAYYGVFPIVSEFKGNKILCAQSGDTMTHSEHRGKGLFVILAKKTYELAKQENIKFIYGFPNQNSYPGFINKLSWKHDIDLNLYCIKVKTLPLAKAIKKIAFFQSFYMFYVNLICMFYKSESFGFKNSLSYESSGCVVHDYTFFNYKKYFKTKVLKIKGKNVWLKIDGRLWIGDIEHSTQDEFNKIMNSLKRMAFFLGTNEIHFHTNPTTKYDSYMQKLGKLKNTNPVGYLNLDSGLDMQGIKFQSGDFDTF